MSRPRKRLVAAIIAVFAVLFQMGASGAEEWNLFPRGFLQALAERISGETAYEHVVSLSGWAKNRPAEEYTGLFYETRYVLDKAKEFGLDRTEVEVFPWTYDCWDPVSAELWLIEPESRKITSLDMVHLCLLEGSKDADLTAEVIDVGSGESPEDYEGKDVAGKIVLCYGNEYLVNTLAVHERGAAGIIGYRSFYPDDYPDMVSWGGLNMELMGKDERSTFGFMISPRQGNQLRRMLDRGVPVKVHAEVKVRTHPGKLDVIQTLIPGGERPNEEILLMAHLFEYYYKQGANDNASGSAAILEVGRVIETMIRDGVIPRPKRSIRILWEPEGWGTFAWMKKYPEAVEKIKAVIDMDMVGSGHALTGAVFRILDTPDSLPHFINAVITELAEYVRLNSGWGSRAGEKSFNDIMASPAGSRDAFHYEVVHFNPRFFNANWLRKPSLLFNCGPDPYYHSSADRPDKCDPTQLKRAAFLGAAAALYLADLDREDVEPLAARVLAEEGRRLAGDEEKALFLLSRSDPRSLDDDYKDALNIIRQGIRRRREAVLSIGAYLDLEPDAAARLAALVPDEKPSSLSLLSRYYSERCRGLNRKPSRPALSAEEIRLSHIVPERLVGYEMLVDFLYLEHQLSDPDINAKIRLNQVDPMASWETLNFCDGKRSLLDIRNAAAAEFAPAKMTLEDVEFYFDVLEKAGVVRYRRLPT